MKDRIRELLLEKWPDESAAYLVSSVMSPVRNANSKELMIEISFNCEDYHDRFTVMVPWWSLSDFWIGRRFVKAEPVHLPYDIPFLIIDMSELRDRSMGTFKEMGISYGLPSDEYCVSFTYHDERFIVPCLEVVRGFFSFNNIILDSLFYAEGIEKFIQIDTWQEYNATDGEHGVQFSYCKKCWGIGQNAASRLAGILGSNILLCATRKIQQSYRLYGKIKIDIPIIEKGIIVASNVFHLGNVNLIGEICPYLPVQYYYTKVINRKWYGSDRPIYYISGKPCWCYTNADCVNRALHLSKRIRHRPTVSKTAGKDEINRNLLLYYERCSYYLRDIPLLEDYLCPFCTDLIIKHKREIENKETML